MTTSRFVRSTTKARICLYICAVLLLTGLIACYNNTLVQLDDTKRSNEMCHKQEEHLSTQLQVISDYKQHLEKALKSERAEHQQIKSDLENRLGEDRVKNEKSNGEASLRFNSLQQHYNLLQTEHDDFKEKCTQTQHDQLTEINALQAKLKEVQEQFKKVESAKENLKTQYLQMQTDKENLEKQLVKLSGKSDNSSDNKLINNYIQLNHDLQTALDSLKEKCSNYDTIQAPVSAQPITIIKQQQDKSTTKKILSEIVKKDQQNFAEQVQLPNSLEYEIKLNKKKSDLINDDNKLQQQEMLEEKSVLALPNSNVDNNNNNMIKSSSSTTSTTTASFNLLKKKLSSKASLNGARPLLMPTMTPYFKKIPDGVVPVPVAEEVPLVKQFDNNNIRNELPNETINNNNRYRNKIDEDDKKLVDVVDKENVAHEVFDRSLQQQQQQNNQDAAAAAGGGYDALGFGEVNDLSIKNAENMQNFLMNKQHEHIDTLGGNNNNNNNEFGGDYKDMQNDVQLEENEDGDDDGDDYRDRLARQKDPAVRN